jgi:hypothetical protein
MKRLDYLPQRRSHGLKTGLNDVSSFMSENLNAGAVQVPQWLRGSSQRMRRQQRP